MKRRLLWVLIVGVIVAGFAGYLVYQWYFGGDGSSNDVIREWIINPSSHDRLRNDALTQCDGAPFILPSEGLIGLLWSDTARPYRNGRPHTGIDIFGAGEAGTIPIYAVYDGYLTRLEDWKSTVIIRHDDPLQPGRTIWTYYTHMASRDGTTSYIMDDFPAGTGDVFVEQGTLLAYQGEFAGNAPPIAMHLHLSIVLSDDAGVFLNEAVIGNTLDPSPYFGMPLHIGDDPSRPIRCE